MGSMKTTSCTLRSLVAVLSFLLLLTAFVRQTSADLYVSGYDSNEIYRYTSDGVQHVFASVNYPAGLAFDRANNLYVADTFENTIYKIRPNGQQTIFASGDVIDQPSPIVFDSAGNLYVGHEINAGIVKITPNGRTSVLIENVDAFGLTFDSTGYLYASDNITHDILKIAPDGFAHGFHLMADLKFDSAGNLFLADAVTSLIYKISPQGFKTKYARVSSPLGLLFDHSGYLFVSAGGPGGTILEFAPNGAKSTFATDVIASYLAIPN
jgi:hypothetical protein